jgi:hypothetical protein
MLHVSQHPDRLDITWEGRPLCTYVLHDDDPPHLFRRPYLHPVYTLDGDLVTDCRPTDHPWHKGISMTMSVVNDQNFWGGPTYRDGEYVQLDNVGEVRHEGWGLFNTWGERNLRFNLQQDNSPFWAFSWEMSFDNISGRALRLGSPATEGRVGAGYTGLFWRGAPIFRTAQGGDSSDDGGQAPEDYHGTDAAMLMLTVWDRVKYPPKMGLMFETLFAGSLPTRWFVRAQEYPGVAFSFAFDKAVEVAPGGAFTLEHTIYVTGRPSVTPGRA